MRIVVTGVEGQVVRSLVERGAKRGHEIVPVGRPELDLSGDPDLIAAAVESALPEAVVSAAAYTAVDRAESEPDLAFAVNERGAAAVASAARRSSVPLVHLSTDYVFDGNKGTPYTEDDATGPTGIYGASKLAGEQAVTAEYENCAILRTAWVYSPFGTNFVKTMLRLGAERDELRVVSDQFGNPTSALDIADGALAVVENLAADGDPARRGIFHMAAGGAASWAEFAEAIFAASAEVGGPVATITRIATADFPTAAMRPANSQLDSSKLERAHGVCLPQWQHSVNEVVPRLIRGALARQGIQIR